MTTIEQIVEQLRKSELHLIDYEQYHERSGQVFRFMFKWKFKEEERFAHAVFKIDQLTKTEKDWVQLAANRIVDGVLRFIAQEVKNEQMAN